MNKYFFTAFYRQRRISDVRICCVSTKDIVFQKEDLWSGVPGFRGGGRNGIFRPRLPPAGAGEGRGKDGGKTGAYHSMAEDFAEISRHSKIFLGYRGNFPIKT